MKNLKSIFLLSLACSICSMNCTRDGGSGPGEAKLNVIGGVERRQDSYSDSFYCDEDVAVTNVAVVPSVMINDQELEFQYYGDAFHYDGSFPLNPRSSYALVVTAGSKIAFATVNLPEDFNIITPDSSYVLPKGSDLIILWDYAIHSDCYRVYLYITYHYLDTLEQYCIFHFSDDSILSETSITYGHDMIFPNLSEIETIVWGHASLSIYAIDGPVLVPGSVGNVTGNGIGFFWAHQKRSVNFYVGTHYEISEEEAAEFREAATIRQKGLWNQRIEHLQEAGEW